MAANGRELGPCDNCRDRHVKCDRGAPCGNCVKYDYRCSREQTFRFKRAPRFKSNLSFSADQPWLASNTDQLSYIDMTKKVTRKHGKRAAQETSEASDSQTPPRSTRIRTDNVSEEEAITDPAYETLASRPNTRRASSFSSPGRPLVFNGNFGDSENAENNGYNTMSPPSTQWRSTQLEAVVSPPTGPDSTRDNWRPSPREYTSPLAIHHSNHTSPIAAATNRSNQSTALSGVPETATDTSYLGLQEACLIRYFIERLGRWFDSTDRDRHYALVVPQRAMFCPILLYALYATAARHLTRAHNMRNSEGIIVYEGTPLPGLTEESAINYHNVCINHLIEISNDPSQSYNEDALTAATILRFYEQIDAPSTGGDSQVYQSVIQAVIDTQKDPSFYAIWKIEGPNRDMDLYASPATSLRHHACILALLQEIWTVLLSQRPCRLPLCPNNDYSPSSLPPADDYVWTKRIAVWACDVMKFCFGDENSNTVHMSTKTRIEHWEALKQFEDSWSTLQPPCFKPIYYAPPDLSQGKVFPEYWHTNDAQVVALQHVELAKVMLTVHNPKLPRLGLGAQAAQRLTKAQIKESFMKICGLGNSARQNPAALVTTAVGISVCGESVTDPIEQAAVVEFMEMLENEWAWPTKAVVEALTAAWAGA